MAVLCVGPLCLYGGDPVILHTTLLAELWEQAVKRLTGSG